MLRGVDSKDIFKHWKTNGLGVNHANNATAKVTAHNSNSTKNETSGGLLSQLKNERMGRLATIQQGNLRHSRFGGLFAVSSNSVQNRNAVDSLPLDGFSTPAQGHNVATSSSNNVTDKHEHGGMNRQTLVQNPFRSVADNLHQANQRKTKANVPFAADNIEDESLVSAHAIPSHLISNCLSVLVTFLERFTKRGFEKLVHIVKEDRRRDENRVGEGAEELEFFHIIRMCLKYHRSKVLHRRDHNIKVYHQMIDTKPDLVDPSTSWVPNIRCMMAALDRMSFIRVIDAINRALRNKKYENVIVPMETFKEMLCYINLMLQSTNNAHHELAIAALHPLFYTIRADRLDPLPALLREWKPSIYKRKHGHVLIELVHETLKTLDAAKNCFKGRENESDLKKSGRSVETDIDRYVIACLRFDESEYFARIVTNHTVRFYTVMLNDYRVTNNQTIHHYMYCFLQRMYAHKIENDRYGITSDEFSNDKNGGNGNVTLAYLLFNIHTLNAINNILVYNNSKYDKENTPLIRLLRCIVRLFAECAQKNHMLFVEALFAHAHPMDFALSLDTVYDAKMFATTQSKSMVDRNRSGAGYSEDEDSTGGDYSDKGINSTTKTNIESASANTNSAIAPSSTEEASYDFGDEFDENELPSSFNRLKKHNDKKGSKSTRRRLGTKTKELVKANHSASRDEDSDSDSATQTQTPANSSPRSSSKKASTTNTNSPGKRKWTQEHDEVLREQYSLYQSSRSCYDMIASHELFRYVECVLYIMFQYGYNDLCFIMYLMVIVIITMPSRLENVSRR